MGAAELMQTLSNRSLELSRFLTAYRSLQPRQMAEAPLSPAAIRNDPLDAIGSDSADLLEKRRSSVPPRHARPRFVPKTSWLIARVRRPLPPRAAGSHA